MQKDDKIPFKNRKKKMHKKGVIKFKLIIMILICFSVTNNKDNDCSDQNQQNRILHIFIFYYILLLVVKKSTVQSL